MRNFGITRDQLPSQVAQHISVAKIHSSRAGLGGMSTDAAATHGSQYAPRDSNVYYLPPSPSAFISPPAEPDSSDLEFGAFCFALVGLCSPFAVTGAAITVWLLFFS